MKTSKEFNLYQLTGAIAELDQRLETEIVNKTGEVIELSKEDQDLIIAIMTDKIDGCVDYFHYLGDHSEILKKRAEAFTKAAKLAEKKQESFKNYLELCMSRLDMPEIKGATSIVKWQKNPASAEIIDQDKVPARFIQIEQTIKIDKKQILDTLKSGVQVEGCRLVDDKKRLVFKTV